MFEVSFRPWRPSDHARSERSSKLILVWITIVAVIIISFLCLSWEWASIITAFLLISLISFTWYYLRSAPPETAPVHEVRQAVEDGLSPLDIAEIPSFSYQRNSSPDSIHRYGSDEGVGWLQCAVCISTVKEGEMVRQLPICKHMFHVMCIDKWLQSHMTCPMCRADVNPRINTA